MKTLYVYSNELLGDTGAEFNDLSCVDIITGASDEECLEKFDVNYDVNDYSASFTKHPK